MAPDIAAVYHGSLDGFVDRRTELAQQLRSSDADAAVAVRKLRKPPVSVWAIDQLAIENPDLLTELLAAGTDASEAQQQVAEGVCSSDALLTASARVREAVAAAVGATTAVLDRAGHADSEATVRRIRTTLQAAVSGSPGVRLALWRGTLDRDLELAGFGAPEGLEDDPPELASVLAPLRRPASPESGRQASGRTRQPRDLASRRAAERAAAEHHKHAARARAMAGTKRQQADRLAAEARRAEEDAVAAEKAAQAAEDTARTAHAALVPDEAAQP